jgi:hypothetical protein
MADTSETMNATEEMPTEKLTKMEEVKKVSNASIRKYVPDCAIEAICL